MAWPALSLLVGLTWQALASVVSVVRSIFSKMISIHKKKKRSAGHALAWPVSYGNRCGWAGKEVGGMAGWCYGVL